MTANEYKIPAQGNGLFQNHCDFCVGTGRMGLALQKEYEDELAFVQQTIGFSHIRGHGLFHDDMGIYQYWKSPDGTVLEGYNFTYLDRVMDSYLKLGIRPFLELGFMPEKMARGEQTIFYWRGHTTPPASYEKWAELVQATLRHLMERYGREEVEAWPIEVWNEPNLPGFWENADQQEYFRLYDVTARAVKEVSSAFRVGGPAVCGGDSCKPWIRAFLNHCRDEQVPVDFLTRHLYMGQTPERKGRYLYHDMCTPAYTINEARETRELVDSFPEYKGMEIHVTEFNTSYNPFCPTHDTVYNAALVAGLLSGLGDICASYSYWTFGDVFEEMGVPDRPFHGGFGLVAAGLIPKPTYWTYRFFKDMQGELLLRNEECVAVKSAENEYRTVLWNLEAKEKRISLLLPETEGEWSVVCQKVDEEHGNPLMLWHEMGEPASLTREQLTLLRECAHPETTGSRKAASEAGLRLDIILPPCAVANLTVKKVKEETSPGYVYPGIGRE